MTVRAKTLVKDKFWIVEERGQKLGTLQKKDDNGWIFLSKKDHRQVFHTQESLFTKFGFNIFEEKQKIFDEDFEEETTTMETAEIWSFKGKSNTGYLEEQMSLITKYLDWVEQGQKKVNMYPRPITEPIYIVDKDDD